MVFNSVSFLIFFLLFFPIYWFINNRCSVIIRNIFLIASSYIFYGWWDWRFLSLIIISSTIDYIIGLKLHITTIKSHRKLLLIVSLLVNLGILGFFKYFNFFIESFNELLSIFPINLDSSTLKIILPIGISFYTFQTLSYTIDIYKKKIEPTRDIYSFFAFVSFFPQLVSGPIERASHLLQQFHEKKAFNHKLCVAGLRLMLWGFFKKIVIADNFGILADSIFNPDLSASGLTIIIGAIFFAFQIYADFSGYSDIAIGIARMFGFDIIQNFKTPYYAASFGEFWRRWHISLSTWFRDYVYIPLGGNKGKISRVYLNISITFLLSGLWHGADFTFLIWGGLHGLVLIIEKHIDIKLHKIYYYPVVLICVTLFWIPFRAEDLGHLADMVNSVIHLSSYSFVQIEQIVSDFSMIRFSTLITVLVAFMGVEFLMKSKYFNEWVGDRRRITRILIYYALIFAILLIGNFSVKPSFIYFQF